MNLRLLILAAIGGAVQLHGLTTAKATPPPNDDFANRMVLTGQAVSSTPVDITDATREGLERMETADQTVWYTWTPSADGIVTITTNTSTFYNRVISVFNGDSLANLTLDYTTFDYENDDLDDTDLTFPVKAGVAYQISIGNLQGSTESGTAVLNIINAATTITAPVVICTPADGNNNFDNAQSLGSYPVVSGFSYNRDATSEGLESTSDGTNTVWWTWTAPADGTLSFGTSGTDFNHILSVYVGSSLGTLQSNGHESGFASRPVTASGTVTGGTAYKFAIGGSDGDNGTAVLNLSFAPTSVQVNVTAAGVLEAGTGENNAFTVTLSSVASSDINVAYIVKGSAEAGVDYAPLKGTVKIKAGKTSKVIKVDLEGDLGGASKKTVKLTLEAGSGYTVGASSAAKVKIVGF